MLLNYIGIKKEEKKQLILSWFVLFCISLSWYIIRPFRESIVSKWDDESLQIIWSYVFIFSFIATIIYCKCCQHINLKTVVITFYITSSLIFFLFYTEYLLHTFDFDVTFYVWCSLFSLMNISIFWSIMSDIHLTNQSKRLFSIISSAASFGAVLGPTVSLFLSQKSALLVISILLMIPSGIIFKLYSISNINYTDKNMNYSIVDAFKSIYKRSILRNISIFIFLLTVVNVYTYVLLKNKLNIFDDQNTRKSVYAFIDLSVNISSIVISIFITPKLLKRFGMVTLLCITPVILTISLVTFSFFPILVLLKIIIILRRTGEYSISKPAREMYFTLVSRENRFQSKSQIDIIWCRFCDFFWIYVLNIFTLYRHWFVCILTSCTIIMAIYLGKQFKQQK